MYTDDLGEVADDTPVNVKLVAERLPVELRLLLVKLADLVVRFTGVLERLVELRAPTPARVVGLKGVAQSTETLAYLLELALVQHLVLLRLVRRHRHKVLHYWVQTRYEPVRIELFLDYNREIYCEFMVVKVNVIR